MKNIETKDFIGYEYLSINVNSEKESLYIDCYENFGWNLIKSINNGLVDKDDYYINNYVQKTVNLKFKRDRKISHKVKLIALQKKCEKGLKELERLEKEPIRNASIYAILIAVVGTILGILGILIIPFNIVGIISCLFGLICFGVNYLVYRKIKIKQEKINEPLIEEVYNEIYNSCEEAQKLLK